MSVTFIDNSEEVKAAMHDALLRALVKIGMTAEKYARRLCPVDSTNLRTHITHQVDKAEPVTRPTELVSMSRATNLAWGNGCSP